MRAIRFHSHGGPEVLQVDEVPVPTPAAGEVRIRVEAAGINFIDVYLRSGFYPSGPLPAVAGKEGAGVVEAVGPGVDGIQPGDRVGFFDAAGSYAEQVLLPAARAIPLPEGISTRVAAAVLLQGMTAHYLTWGIRPLSSGDRVLIHAIAGGVGLLAAQMAKVAFEKENENKEFYGSKIKTARFFMTRMLPEADARFKMILAGAAPLMDMKEAEF